MQEVETRNPNDMMIPKKETGNARWLLRYAALFLGELRDGLTMINMQSAFLIVSKNYKEKQAGILFFTFGMAQFLFQTPAGYIMDYSDKKIAWLSFAAVATTCLTIFTAIFAADDGGNLGLMILVKLFQGAVTAMIPPGLNSITQGIVGAVGMTEQVSINEMMNHLGTAILVLIGSLIAFALYPDIGVLFVVSPIACAAFLYFISRINPDDIDHDAARGLTLETKENTPSSPALSQKSTNNDGDSVATGNTKKPIQHKPSFNFFGGATNSEDGAELKADSPFQILRDPILLLFILVCFLFHTANGTVLPLCMQSLAIGSGRSGILMSGLCIIIAQTFMVMSAKVCGTYSKIYGRKTLFLIGLFSVPIRCLILTFLIGLRDESGGSAFLQTLILSTQVLDGVGAGVFGTMYILVTSDISGGTGRFSLTLGLTTAAMSIGGTVSGYLGQALAQDLGYKQAFFILAFLSLVPAVLYLTCMPETLPELTKDKEAAQNMASIQEEEEQDPKTWTNEENSKPATKYVELV
mmetsp:Transcript_26676/g.37594  ORF Transcript_26676/g.37594 Transcript_26676/m.37594 type:complete len:524 (-) Transcript_26676:135-1706(-)